MPKIWRKLASEAQNRHNSLLTGENSLHYVIFVALIDKMMYNKDVI